MLVHQFCFGMRVFGSEGSGIEHCADISTLLLQNSCSEDMLGRIMSMDLLLATLGETLTAVVAGVLQDYARFSAEQVSLVMALTAFVSTSVWGILGF